MFDKVSSQKLRQMMEELGRIGDQYSFGEKDEKALRFARSLSVLMRCELAERQFREDDAEMTRRILTHSENDHE